jgi:hypothetical protein
VEPCFCAWVLKNVLEKGLPEKEKGASWEACAEIHLYI